MKDEYYKGIWLVYSPDDNGWYASTIDNKTSKKIYKTRELLIKDIDNNKIKWV